MFVKTLLVLEAADKRATAKQVDSAGQSPLLRVLDGILSQWSVSTFTCIGPSRAPSKAGGRFS